MVSGVLTGFYCRANLIVNLTTSFPGCIYKRQRIPRKTIRLVIIDNLVQTLAMFFPRWLRWSKKRILLVFSVTPLKIDQNKNQNHSTDKVQNLENEGR